MLLHRGVFDRFRALDTESIINEGYLRSESFRPTAIRSGSGIPIFISHKHSDLNDLEGILTYFQKHFRVVPYLDCFDDGMPLATCAETAIRIKQVIEYCPKFIFLATEDALRSKWCNWEVGIADQLKFPTFDMAVFPLLDSGTSAKKYIGNEYLQIYPYIEAVNNASGVGHHLSVSVPSSHGLNRVSLGAWLNNRLED